MPTPVPEPLLKLPGTDTVITSPALSPLVSKFPNGTFGEILATILPYVFSIAGIILFIVLLMGGFSLLTSAGSPDNVEKGKKMITSAIIGFVIIFISYWLMQILQIVFGAKLGF